MNGQEELPGDDLAQEESHFIDEHLFSIGLSDEVAGFLGDSICLVAFRSERRLRRPMHRNQTAPSQRHLVPTPADKLKAQRVLQSIPDLRVRMQEEGETPALIDELGKLLNCLARFFFMRELPAKRARGTRTPRMRTVSDAMEHFENNPRLFADIICGWSPQQVRELAHVLGEFIPELNDSITAEERILNLLARLKQNVASWESQAFLFQRSPSCLCAMFTATTKLILDKFDFLLSVEHLSLIPADFVVRSEQAFLEKYRFFKKDPDAELPEDYRSISALMDGSHFPICRPGGAKDADVQRAFYTAYKKAHTLNVLFIVLANGLRIYAGFATGRHADPYLYTNALHTACESVGLTLLCDAIFARNQVCKPMMGLANNTMSPMECIIQSALRIPVEWAMLQTQDMPLLKATSKIKFFHSRPRAIIELGVLLANFKLCLKGENITTYFGLQPPSLRAYLSGAVQGRHADDDDDDFDLFADEDEGVFDEEDDESVDEEDAFDEEDEDAFDEEDEGSAEEEDDESVDESVDEEDDV